MVALKKILESIKHPHKVTFEAGDFTPTYGKFTAQPFERGYATTVGVALRRVLLSSIPGYAISAIKIEGVSNEFENFAGIKEDTIVMMMHFKGVTVSLAEHLDLKVIHIKKEGPAMFTAADIAAADSEVTVYNPDHHIATIEEGYTLEMDLQIECGYGYSPANLDSMEAVDAIGLDTVYSPITSVKYDVSDIRVGQRTDYGKLTLEIETKGNIAPDRALSYATKILRDNLATFLMPEEIDLNDGIKTDTSKNDVLEVLKKKHIEDLEFSIRTANFLIASDLKTLDKVAQKTEQDILRFKDSNEMIIEEIKEKLDEFGAHLGMKS